jgi:MFS family permease
MHCPRSQEKTGEMMKTRPRFHPAFLVLAVTFCALLVSAGVRSAPGVLIFPLELHFRWSRAAISFAAASGILLYGLTAPFAAALMHQFGIRRTMLLGLGLMALSSFASLWMHSYWQFLLTWGMLSGIGSGAVASVLGAAIVNRWFKARRGLAMGLLGASTATGSLVIVPLLAWLSNGVAWRSSVIFVTIACAALVPVVALLVPERPEDKGFRRFGETEADIVAKAAPMERWMALSVLRRSSRRPVFWLLAGSFFVCGLTTNGLIGTHMIAYCGDHGIAPVAAGGVLAAMGLFDLVGTTASGWLTDRYNPRRLLAMYYGMRGASLLALPFLDFGKASLGLFAVFYGLNWIATLPPTVRITNEEFGESEGPVVYGWVQVAHQFGAATAAYGAGLTRQLTGHYDAMFLAAGAIAVLTMLAMERSARVVAARPHPMVAS